MKTATIERHGNLYVITRDKEGKIRSLRHVDETARKKVKKLHPSTVKRDLLSTKRSNSWKRAFLVRKLRSADNAR